MSIYTPIESSDRIFTILSSIDHNTFYLQRYLKFLVSCSISNTITNNLRYENHHICPKSLFPEYKKFNLYPWNKIRLTLRQHFIAHLILAKAFGGSMYYCFGRMSKQCNININSKKYENLRKKISSERAMAGKNKKWWVNKITNECKFYDTCPGENFIRGRGTTFNKGNKGKVGAFNKETLVGIFLSPDEKLPPGFVYGSPKSMQILWYNTDTNKSEFFYPHETPGENYVRGSPNSATWRMRNIYTQEIIFSKTNYIDDNWVAEGNNFNKIWVTNGVDYILVNKNNIPAGYVPGSAHQNGIQRTIGRIWYHSPDGSKSKMLKPSDEIPPGWIKGRR